MKTTYLKLLSVAALLISFCSCSSDDSSSNNQNGIGDSSSSLGGSYKIVAMDCDMAVDLNNDGLASTDMFMEIDPAFFDASTPELEIKPIVYNNQLEDLMSFYLPHSNVVATTPTKPGTVKFTRSGLGYVFEFDNKTQSISLENNNSSPDPAIYGSMQSIKVVSKGSLKAIFKKYYYDFATVKWQLLTITCVYKKVN